MSESPIRAEAGERILLDPTGERAAAVRARLQRPKSLAGLTVGLLDISKPRGDLFLDRIEQRLVERGVAVKRFQKPTFTKPAPAAVLQEIAASCDLVLEALAD